MAKCSVCFSRLLSSHTHTHLTPWHSCSGCGAEIRGVNSSRHRVVLPPPPISQYPYRLVPSAHTYGRGRLGAAPDLLLCFLLALHFRPLLVRGWVRRLYSEALPTTPSARWLGKAWFPSSVEPGREEEGLSGRELTGQELVGKGSKIKLKPSKQGWRL